MYCAFEQTIPASSSSGLSSPAMDTSEILHKFIFYFCMTSKHKASSSRQFNHAAIYRDNKKLNPKLAVDYVQWDKSQGIYIIQ